MTKSTKSTNVSQAIERWVIKALGATQRWVYRASGGRVFTTMKQMPVLLLRTTGRKTGKARTWPLGYLRSGDNVVIITSNGGLPHHPAWYHNLRAEPCVAIQIGGETRLVWAETAGPEERARLWGRLVREYRHFGGYQRRTAREIPVVLLRPRPPAGVAAAAPAGAAAGAG